MVIFTWVEVAVLGLVILKRERLLALYADPDVLDGFALELVRGCLDGSQGVVVLNCLFAYGHIIADCEKDGAEMVLRQHDDFI